MYYTISLIIHCSPILWNHPTTASVFPRSRYKSMLISSECAPAPPPTHSQTHYKISWTHCSVVWSWAVSAGDIEEHMSVTRWHIESSVVLAKPEELSKGHKPPHGHRLRISTPREDGALIRIMRRNRFLSSSRIKVELIRRTGRRVSARTAQTHLVAAGYHSRRPARCSRLRIIVTDAAYAHAGTGTGPISTALMWYFLMSPG